MSFPVVVVAKLSRSGEQCDCSCETWSKHESDNGDDWPLCACIACGPGVDGLGRRCRQRVSPLRGLGEAMIRGSWAKECSSVDDFPGHCGDCREHVALGLKMFARIAPKSLDRTQVVQVTMGA